MINQYNASSIDIKPVELISRLEQYSLLLVFAIGGFAVTASSVYHDYKRIPNLRYFRHGMKTIRK